jgi:hypothetical protein
MVASAIEQELVGICKVEASQFQNCFCANIGY